MAPVVSSPRGTAPSAQGASPSTPGPRRGRPALLAGPQIVSDTLVGGFLGYVAVVVSVGVLDLFQGHALFHTPSVVGGWLFFDGVANGAVQAAPVLAYNALHLTISLVAGAVGGLLIRQAERTPGFWYLGLMLVLASITYALTLLGGIGVEGRHLVNWWTVVVGTTAWFGALIGYFWWSHPGVLDVMQEAMEEVVE